MTAQPHEQHPGCPLNQAEAAVSTLPLPPVQSHYAVNTTQTFVCAHNSSLKMATKLAIHCVHVKHICFEDCLGKT